MKPPEESNSASATGKKQMAVAFKNQHGLLQKRNVVSDREEKGVKERSVS